MDTTRDLQLPSGWEVESATLHPPVHEVSEGGFRGRLDALKARGLTKVHDIQRVVAERGTSLQTNAKTQMTNSPMKWAGIAAGAGFALGLVGRIAQARNKRKNAMPTLVIVEARC